MKHCPSTKLYIAVSTSLNQWKPVLGSRAPPLHISNHRVRSLTFDLDIRKRPRDKKDSIIPYINRTPKKKKNLKEGLNQWPSDYKREASTTKAILSVFWVYTGTDLWPQMLLITLKMKVISLDQLLRLLKASPVNMCPFFSKSGFTKSGLAYLNRVS